MKGERTRPLGWLSAVLLLVLLTAAGVPEANAHALATQRHEIGCEADLRAHATAGHGAETSGAAGRHAVEPAVPPLRRWRGQTVRGLPPARAPTA